jgi:hypothetical protein
LELNPDLKLLGGNSPRHFYGRDIRKLTDAYEKEAGRKFLEAERIEKLKTMEPAFVSGNEAPPISSSSMNVRFHDALELNIYIICSNYGLTGIS